MGGGSPQHSLDEESAAAHSAVNGEDMELVESWRVPVPTDRRSAVASPAEDWMSYDERREMQERQRAESYALAKRVYTTVDDARMRLRDKRVHCFLCRWGVESQDAGPHGTGLFIELNRLIARHLGHMTIEGVVAMAYDFHHDHMVPHFERVGVTLFPFDFEIVLEHLSTTIHTKNPVLMLLQMIDDMQMEIAEAKNYARQRGKAPDHRMLAELRKHRLAVVAMYRAAAKPGDMAFNEVIDGEVRPELVQRLVPAVRGITETVHDMSPGSLDWMIARDEQEATMASSPLVPEPEEDDELPEHESIRALIPRFG